MSEEKNEWAFCLFQPDASLSAVKFSIRIGSNMYNFFKQCAKTTNTSVEEEEKRYSKRL